MGRSWNLTGLYKASKDRMPAARSRRIRSTPPAAQIVVAPRDPECERCGFGMTTNAHRIYCVNAIDKRNQGT